MARCRCRFSSCRSKASFAAVAALATLLQSPSTLAEEPSGLAAAAALENALVQTIASAEKSVVAIARVRKEQGRKTPFAWSSVPIRSDAACRLPGLPSPPTLISFPTNMERAW